MASVQSAGVLREVGRLFGAGTVAGLSEGQLLERFVARRDEAAFEALVARHGPMVLGVCRRGLRDSHDVDDAFQATFLVLASKAGSIRDGERLGPWLHRVTRRVVGRARRGESRWRAGDIGSVAADGGEPSAAAERAELGPLLHEELDRLPGSYRAVVVLCHLQGLTHDEAARRLGWPVGTVRGRLSRARGVLRDRLTRRGVAPAVVVAALGALERGAEAAVPPSLAATAVRLGLGGSGARIASARAVALAKGVLGGMLMAKLKAIGAAGAAALGLALLAGPAAGDPQQRGESDRPRAAPATKAEIPPTPADLDRALVETTRRVADERKKLAEAEAELRRLKFLRRAGASAKGDPDPGPTPAGVAVLAVPKAKPLPKYVVEPPDMLIVEVLEALPGRPITGERLIRPDGTISLGFYGDLYVSGLTVDEIKEKVILHLRKTLNDEVLGLVEMDENGARHAIAPRDSNRVFVDVAAYNSKVYYVQGEVAAPGRLPITGNDTVLDAINYAGGLTATADPKTIRLVRPSPGSGQDLAKVLPIDYEAIVKRGDPTTNYQLLPGDQLVVDRLPAEEIVRIAPPVVPLERPPVEERLSRLEGMMEEILKELKALRGGEKPE